MSELDDLIRRALGDDHDPQAPDETLGTRAVDGFLRHSRWVAGFAWMKMGGTLAIGIVAALFFFTVETTRSQILCATLVLVGFIGFAMWWIWYWMALNRSAVLREIKRLELQLAEQRPAGS